MRRYLVFLFLIIVMGYGLWYFPSLKPLSSHQNVLTRHTQLAAFQGVAMTMPYRISVEAPLDPKMQEKCEKTIKKVFDHVDQVFNRYNSNSQLSAFNNNKSCEPIQVLPELYQMLQLGNELWNLSRGIYDPTICVVSKLWRAHLKDGRIPPLEDRLACEQITGWKHIHFYPDNRISKDHPLVNLDLNSMAKGYAVDKIGEALKELGLQHIFVEWAGEVRVFGGHPSHRYWVVGIKTPKKDDYSYLAKIELMNGAVATSGHDELFWIATDDEGHEHSYSHLMHSIKKSPLKIEERQILSCTVLASSCMLADSLATTGLLFDDVQEAQKWAIEIIHKWPDITVFFFTQDQQLWRLSGTQSKVSHTLGNVELYHSVDV